MNLDSLIAGACLAAVPAAGVGLYALRAEPPAPPPAAPTAEAPAPPKAPSAPEPEVTVRSEAEIEIARPKAKRWNPDTQLAADLPLARNPVPIAPRPRSTPKKKVGPCGGVEVRLISLSDDPSWSMATLAESPGAPASSRRVGDEVGAWRVAEIEWNRVWLESGSGRCAVTMKPEKAPKAPDAKPLRSGHLEIASVEDSAVEQTAGAPPFENEPAEAVPSLDDDLPKWALSEGLAAALQPVGERAYRLTGATVAEIFDRAEDLLSGVRLTPRPEGIEVSGIRAGSLLDHLGLGDGDVLTSINGQPCSDEDTVFRILRAAREAGLVEADLVRDGAPFVIRVASAGSAGASFDLQR